MNTNRKENKGADDVRVAYPLFQGESGGSTPTSALQLTIVEIPTSKAAFLNALWHSRLPKYETGFCLTSKICFAAIHENIFFATAIWSAPVARLLLQQEWMELRRLAIAPDAPKNTASRMLAVMTRIIQKRFPEVKRLISYQDTQVHKGTIYKAAGWIIGKEHSGGSWNRPNSFNTYNRKSRTRPDGNDAIGPKIRWEKLIKKNKSC